MFNFICPVCRAPLNKNGNSYICKSCHTFDISKRGYVNLLLSSKSTHGDDRLMVKARNDFLNKGYYEPLKVKLCDIISNKISEIRNCKIVEDSHVILDAGCGECYYTSGFADIDSSVDVVGIDLSKDAIICGAKRNPSLNLAVASVNQIPLPERSVDMIISTFAPLAAEEFFRVLKRKGFLIRVFPLARHLWQLKSVLYDIPYENIEETVVPVGFEEIGTEKIRYNATIRKEDIFNLFTMTPYYYRTGEDSVNKLKVLDELETEISFGITVYRKV